MSDTRKKYSFLVYILKNKYNKSLDKYSTFTEILSILDITNKDLVNTFCKYLDGTTDLSKDQICDLLATLNNTKPGDKFFMDFLFCLINADTTTLKLLKDKENNFDNLRTVYQESFVSNKSYLKEFNTKDKPKKTGTLTKEDTAPAVTRFSPEPAGCLHIGHVKALMVNYNMAKKSNGKFLIRFDDTNPIKDYEKYEKEIIKDLDTLNIKDYTVSHSSDYFDMLVEKAKFLIKKELAYCDNTDQEIMRNQRMHGIESSHRNNPVDFNLEYFQKMLDGCAEGFCLRAKIDMSNLNKTMRDPVIYRSSAKEHSRNNKYKAYPTYDFVCPILDSVEGVTVACRADEYRDRNEQYRWFLKNLELVNKPSLSDFSKLNFEDTVLSKRKIDKLISEGYVAGWDDPRLSTVQGIKRSGMDMEALKDYINLQGASNKTNTITWDKVWAMNKKAIDSRSPRYMAVEKDNFVRVTVNGIREEVPFYKNQLLHKKNESLGFKKVLYDKFILLSQEDAQNLDLGEEFTLMSWGNAFVESKDVVDGIVKEMSVGLHLEGDYKKTKHKISWISELGSVLVKGVEYSNILSSDEINTESMKEKFYYVESAVFYNMKEETCLQFERIGFYYRDKPFTFNLIPCTRQKRIY
jgi:glutamyl-tRNA synthetase